MSSPRHLLDVADLDAGEVRAVLDLAAVPPDELGHPLAGQGVALLFEKPSTRTRHSTEMAVVQLGGHPVYTRPEEVGLDDREPVEDVTRILAGYHRALAARVFRHQVLERMAAVSTVPVVNLLSDRSHPLQAFADVLTMEEALGPLGGRRIAWIGDYNNVARSLGEIGVLLGAELAFAGPPGFAVDDDEVARLSALGAGAVVRAERPQDAVAGAVAVHTDTWVSMGQEDDSGSRQAAFAGFTVDDELMAAAAPEAVFLHCLPAHRGEEVTASVIDGPRSLVVPQAHHRLDAARAALAFLLDQRPGGAA